MKKTIVQKDITSKYRQDIKELEAMLRESKENSSYYKGRYEEATRKNDEDKRNMLEERHYLRDLQHSIETEVRYLRDLVVHLTLTPDKIEAMKKGSKIVDPNTGALSNY